jgi:3-phenylpropionate/cinnamic acid dioxygenase small subunit
MDNNNRNIPTAGPDLEHLLVQDVVIEAGTDAATAAGETGARREAPDHSPRAPQAGATAPGRSVPAAGLLNGSADLQREVEQFLYRQAEMLDDKQWQPYIDLFTDDGVYWMPVQPQQTEWEGSPSIFAEDRLMMEIRKGRITHPNAWSQAPMWETNHLVSHVALEALSEKVIKVRSRFHFMELRRDNVRHFGGRYQHWLVRQPDGSLRIKLQRVDLFNSQAPFDYVLQVWM